MGQNSETEALQLGQEVATRGCLVIVLVPHFPPLSGWSSIL